MSLARRYAAFVADHSRLVLLGFLVATLVVGSAAGSVDSELTIASFESDSTAAEKLDYAETNFEIEGGNTTVVQVVVRDDDALSRDSLLAGLRLQRSLREDASVNDTLAAEPGILGIENLVATAAIRADGGSPPGGGAASAGASPPLATQIEQLESMSEAEVASVVDRLLSADVEGPPAGVDPYRLLPTDYDRGSGTADSRIVFVTQAIGDAGADDLPPEMVGAQLAIRDLVVSQPGLGDAFAFGAGIVDEESSRATGESFAIISPVALLLLVGLLAVAYRDLLDVLLGMVGVVLVLVWMAGAMGWTDIGVTQILIAVPFLLIGLSVDYALHVVMRYREADAAGEADGDRPDPRTAMRVGLAGVVVALAAATVTTSVGFLANATSPIVSIREFGIVAAAGIVSAFVVFAAFLPALKVELEGLARGIGLSRRKSAFGTGGVAGRLLRGGARLARRAPVAILVVALVLGAGGAVAATDIETSLDRVDFLPRDSPEWMDSLPGPFQPSDYRLRAQATYLNDRFVQARGASEATFVMEGAVTADDTLERVAAAESTLAQQSTPIRLASGEFDTTGPIETIQRVAGENDTVATIIEDSDADGNGVPDRNLAAVYDAVYAAAPSEAAGVVHREDGEYRALRRTVALTGGADTATVTREMRHVATAIEGDSDLTVTATGQPIVQEVVQRALLETLVTGLTLTLVVIGVFLSVIFWRRHGAPALGPVVLFPVVCALAWILGTMYLAGIPFNSETAIIASIAIGIGVDYAIHIGERFLEERGQESDAGAALDRTLRGTGGALLASAVSTASGFGVLYLALVPSLRRFGFVTATAIAYAFVASVLLLPGLLVLWERWRGDAVLSPD